MKKLLSSEDSGVGMSGCNDPIVEMAMTAFSSLMLLAVQIDNKNEEEQKTAISKQMDSGRINLKSLLPGMKNCELAISENGKAILRVNNGELRMSRELTTAELSRLSATLNNNTLTEEAKRIRVTGMLNTVILSEAASQNFEQGDVPTAGTDREPKKIEAWRYGKMRDDTAMQMSVRTILPCLVCPALLPTLRLGSNAHM